MSMVERLGEGLLVRVPTGCPPELAARIEAHNRAAADWRARYDHLDVAGESLAKAARERIAPAESIMAGIAALKADTEDTFKEFHFLLAARGALVEDLYAVVAEIDRRVIFALGPEIRAAEDALRRSGWPWRYPAGRG